jgi:hypothetical protein
MKPVMRYQSQLLYVGSYKPSREERIRPDRKQFIHSNLGAAPSASPHTSARRLPCTQNPDNPMTTTIVVTQD